MRYPELRIIVIVHYVLAGLVVIATLVVASFWAGMQDGIKAVAGAGVGLVVCVAIIASAEVIRLLVDIEDNTRCLRGASPPVTAPPPPRPNLIPFRRGL